MRKRTDDCRYQNVEETQSRISRRGTYLVSGLCILDYLHLKSHFMHFVQLHRNVVNKSNVKCKQREQFGTTYVHMSFVFTKFRKIERFGEPRSSMPGMKWAVKLKF